jgi:hypothetical protein
MDLNPIRCAGPMPKTDPDLPIDVACGSLGLPRFVPKCAQNVPNSGRTRLAGGDGGGAVDGGNQALQSPVAATVRTAGAAAVQERSRRLAGCGVRPIVSSSGLGPRLRGRPASTRPQG